MKFTGEMLAVCVFGPPNTFRAYFNPRKRTCAGRIRGYSATNGQHITLSPLDYRASFAVNFLVTCSRTHKKWLHLSYKKRWAAPCECTQCKIASNSK